MKKFKKELKSEYEQLSSIKNSDKKVIEPPKKKKKSTTNTIINYFVHENKNKSEDQDNKNNEKEFNDYFEFRNSYLEVLKNRKKDEKEFDILEFWKNNSRFQTLRNISKRYLSFPATSTTSERLFSVSGMIYTKRRNKLSPVLLQSILFLRENNYY